MKVEFSEKKLDLKDRRRLREVLSKKLFSRKFKRLRLRMKRYEKQGKRTKYAITGEAETPEGKIVRAEGVAWQFGLAMKELTGRLSRQIKIRKKR
jgi:hypothetical protein